MTSIRRHRRHRPRRAAAALAAFVAAALVASMAAAPATAQDDSDDPAADYGVGYKIPTDSGRPGGWIGSYKVEGRVVFCADPKKPAPMEADGYSRPATVKAWTNTTGAKVPAEDLQRLSWILSTYGTSTSPTTAAASAAAVWSLAGGGEYGPDGAATRRRIAATGNAKAVTAALRSMLKESNKKAGGLTLTIKTPRKSAVRGQAKATVAVTYAASGKPAAGVPVAANYPFDNRGTQRAITNRRGLVQFTFTPTSTGKNKPLVVTATGAPVWPTMMAPVGNAQRVYLAGQTAPYVKAVDLTLTKATPTLSTTTSAKTVRPGATITDIVTVKKVPTTWSADMTATLYGPFPTQPGAKSCTAAKRVGHVTNRVKGPGRFTTSPIGPLHAPGYYTWVVKIPATAMSKRIGHGCGVPAETTYVERHQPAYVTQVNTQKALVGAQLRDTVNVTGVHPGQPLTFRWTLYGPFAVKPTAASCTPRKQHSTGLVEVTQPGAVTTRPVTITQAGYYTYAESNVASAWYNAAEHPCALVSQTALVEKWTPSFDTTTSLQETTVGTAFHDNVTLTGVPKGHKATAVAFLYGPAPTERSIDCTAKPIRRVTYTVNGPGKYRTPAVTMNQPGWYGWVQTLPASGATRAERTKCIIPAETTRVTRPPFSLTVVPTGADASPAATGTPSGSPTRPYFLLLWALLGAVLAVRYTQPARPTYGDLR